MSADDGASHALLVETPEAECADGGPEAAAAELGSRPDRLEEPDTSYVRLTPEIIEGMQQLASELAVGAVNWTTRSKNLPCSPRTSLVWASAAAHHLREHGHERVGIITAPRSWPNVSEVYRGYVDALQDTGRQPDPNLVAEVDAFTIETGRLGLAHLLEQRYPPSAVFAAGEVLALGALQEAQARQLNVPAQLALCGYTDSPTAALVQPPLTMVSVLAREIGSRAMQRLANLIQGKTLRPRRTTLPVELILRDSCGHHEPDGSHDTAADRAPCSASVQSRPRAVADDSLACTRVLSPDSKGRGSNLSTAETITPMRHAKG